MAINEITKILTILVIFLTYIGRVHSIRCYQCSSTNSTHPFQCNELFTSDIDIEPQPCDAIFEARYCIKHVGRYEALECYQCTSADKWLCMDGKLVKESLQPANCSHVYDPRYCIKTIGRYGVVYKASIGFSPIEIAQLTHTYICVKYATQIDSCPYKRFSLYRCSIYHCFTTANNPNGGVGTKRFCSTSNLGNYCNNVRHQGDKLMYRTCVFTCDSDGCNSVTGLTPMSNAYVISLLLLILFYR